MSLWNKLFRKSIDAQEQIEEESQQPDSQIQDSELESQNLSSASSESNIEQTPTLNEIDSTATSSELPVNLSGSVTMTEAKQDLVDTENIDNNNLFSSDTEQNVPSSEIEEEIETEMALDEEIQAKVKIDAENEALQAELASEQQEVNEDLSFLDGRILPQLKVPDWRQELEFVKERYEPCDLSDHIVKVSKRRLTSRQIDHELAQSRLNAYSRYLDRASRRFKEKIDEDALLNHAKSNLSQWKNEQSKSVGWVLADQVNQEVLKAKQAELDATSFVENNAIFTNPSAIQDYRYFARRIFLIPATTLYLMSVVALTYSKFEWIMKFLPLFNLGLASFQVMVVGVGSYFLLVNFWKYSRKVSRIQRKLVDFNTRYQEQENKIRHSVAEHTRLSQQQPLLEPILEVLARAYRVQLESDVVAKINATTQFDTKTLPACVTLARANDAEESKMVRLKQRALSVLMTPGWRTRGLNEIAKVHAESRMLDATTLSLTSLDTDSVVSASNARRMLLEAFGNTSIHQQVSQKRLVKAIEEIHQEVLTNFTSEDRPRVISLRDDGFDKIAFRTSWLADNDGSEEWIPFLSEILSEETAPFGLFNMNLQVRRSELTKSDEIQSVAVVPKYFTTNNSSLKIEKATTSEVMPLDIVVRVDVSPWADPSAFAVFADDTNRASESNIANNPEVASRQDTSLGGFTGA